MLSNQNSSPQASRCEAIGQVPADQARRNRGEHLPDDALPEDVGGGKLPEGLDEPAVAPRRLGQDDLEDAVAPFGQGDPGIADEVVFPSA